MLMLLFQFLMRFVNVYRVLLIHVFFRVIILYSIVHSKYYSPLSRNLGFCCRRFSWQLEDFLLGFVSLIDDCFQHFCMNNIPIAQLQIVSLVEELLSLCEGIVTFECCNFLSKSDIVLLNAACME